jgi:hypothetical protein
VPLFSTECDPHLARLNYCDLGNVGGILVAAALERNTTVTDLE